MSHHVIFCLGNPSRGDDGLGPAVAQQLPADAHVIEDFQLLVEHCLDLPNAKQTNSAVLFIDAAVNQHQAIAFTELTPKQDHHYLSHALAPDALLGLNQQLFGAAPVSYLLSLKGEQFELGTGLSKKAQRISQQASALVNQILHEENPQRWPHIAATFLTSNHHQEVHAADA